MGRETEEYWKRGFTRLSIFMLLFLAVIIIYIYLIARLLLFGCGHCVFLQILMLIALIGIMKFID